MNYNKKTKKAIKESYRNYLHRFDNTEEFFYSLSGGTKIKLTNTWKHALVGLIIGIICAIFIMLFDVEELIWFLAWSFTLATIIWENNQRLNSKRKWNWIDAIFDFIAGNGAFYLVYFAILKVFYI